MKYRTRKRYGHGGNIDDKKAMILSQIKEVHHHADELEKVLANMDTVDAWVVGKMERATTDLSDITHYLDGTTEYARGGEVRYDIKGNNFSDKIENGKKFKDLIIKVFQNQSGEQTYPQNFIQETALTGKIVKHDGSNYLKDYTMRGTISKFAFLDDKDFIEALKYVDRPAIRKLEDGGMADSEKMIVIAYDGEGSEEWILIEKGLSMQQARELTEQLRLLNLYSEYKILNESEIMANGGMMAKGSKLPTDKKELEKLYYDTIYKKWKKYNSAEDAKEYTEQEIYESKFRVLNDTEFEQIVPDSAGVILKKIWELTPKGVKLKDIFEKSTMKGVSKEGLLKRHGSWKKLADGGTTESAEIDIVKKEDGQFKVYYTKGDISFDGRLRRYHSGRDYEYEFEPDNFDDEKSEEYFYNDGDGVIEKEILDAFYSKKTTEYAKGGKIVGDIGKSGTQYGYTLKEWEEKAEKVGLLVSPKEWWKNQQGKKYKDSFGRTKTIGQFSQDERIEMEYYGYLIAIGMDLGSKKIPKSAIKYVEDNNYKKMARGGKINYEYIPKYEIESINTWDGENIEEKDILDGAYVKKKRKR